MVAELNTKRSKNEISCRRRKKHIIYRFFEKNIFIVVWAIIVIVLLCNNLLLYTEDKQVDYTIKAVFSCTIIGIMLGCFFTVWARMWYEKRASEIKNRENIKNYSRLIKADMERTSRLFKNKRFMLMKISNVTVLKNWIEAFAEISSKINKEEMQELFNYYAQVDKLVEYEKRINKHLEVMQCGALKDYPYMDDYKELIQCFTIELDILFKIESKLIKQRLLELCSGEF